MFPQTNSVGKVLSKLKIRQHCSSAECFIDPSLQIVDHLVLSHKYSSSFSYLMGLYWLQQFSCGFNIQRI